MSAPNPGYATGPQTQPQGPQVPKPPKDVDCPRDPCKGLEDILKEHIDKLAEYINNPNAFDNKGFLKAAGNDAARRARIIDGRVRNLEGQIDNFRRQLAECRKNNPK